MENMNSEARPSTHAPPLAVPDAESARRVVSRWLRTTVGDALYPAWGLDDLMHAGQRHAYPIAGIDLCPVEGIFAFHAVVVINITTDQVVVHDPLYEAGPRSIGQLTFKAAWNAAEREAVIITAGSARP